MASIKKRPNGTYQATIFIGRDANGKQLFKYVTKPTLKECKAAARVIEQEIEEGTFVHVENIRVVAWCEKWLELNKNRFSPGTFVLYKFYYTAHYIPYFGQLKLNQITEIHIRQFMNELQKDKANSTVRRIMSNLKCILEDALKGKSPAKDIKLPKANKHVPKVPTDTEMQIIHDAVKDTRDEPIVLLAAWCGLRRGEIFALKWNDIDWDRGKLRVDESYSINDKKEYEDKAPKSDNGIRDVVIPAYLLGILDTLRKNQTAITQRIFNLRPDYYSGYFGELIDRKKLPDIRFHDLRHYHASWLYSRGVPDQYAAQRLGHDINILKTVYQHLGLDRQIEIDDNIRNMFDGPKEQKNKKTTK